MATLVALGGLIYVGVELGKFENEQAMLAEPELFEKFTCCPAASTSVSDACIQDEDWTRRSQRKLLEEAAVSTPYWPGDFWVVSALRLYM